jgi:hypothetical protein
MNRGSVIHQNPKSNQMLQVKGGGMGSQLLGGSAGGAGTYTSINDYVSTTGRNPFSGGGLTQHNPYSGGGSGMKRLSDKLSDLHYEKKKSRREPNIHFSI